MAEQPTPTEPPQINWHPGFACWMCHGDSVTSFGNSPEQANAEWISACAWFKEREKEDAVRDERRRLSCEISLQYWTEKCRAAIATTKQEPQ